VQAFDPGHLISGKYRLEKMIAKGGMGRVFLATQIPLGRQVAVKVLLPQSLDPEFRKRFLLEASISARLVHRNIVTVHDYGETEDGDLYMAMEYLDGEPLSKLISRQVRIPSERACRIAIQICRGLRAAHQKGVVHRDLKPSNIMLLREDEEEEDGVEPGDFIKILDFGLVKVFDPQDKEIPLSTDLTRAGTLLGSPKYMAPEQIRCLPIDPRTDVYSLGVIMFQMLAGRAPFLGPTSVEILNLHLKEPPPSIAAIINDADDLAPELEVIVRRAMEKDPADRYQSMDELLSDLKAAHRLISGATMQSSIITPTPMPMPMPMPMPIPETADEPAAASEQRMRGLARLLVAAIAMTAAVLSGVAFVKLRGPDPEPVPVKKSISQPEPAEERIEDEETNPAFGPKRPVRVIEPDPVR
jgi:serine/threonine-protein kinase